MNDEQKARVIANCEAVAKSLREGKPLQWRRRDSASEWMDDSTAPMFGAASLEYRIKPEPRTIFVNEYPLGLYAYGSPIEANGAAFGCSPTRIAVEYREVVK